MAGKIHIHQTLHGYDRGHRLLSSSVELSSVAHRTLLYLSDLSGTGRAEGFEAYLTGYPIFDMGVYALAQTWEAPELERPGCVFTHTLLIGFTELAQIANLNALLVLFRRPNKQFDAATYSVPLLHKEMHAKSRLINEFQTAALLTALYAHGEQPVVIASEQSTEWEDSILSVWSQMWPRLRRHFLFSTGSLGPRSLDGIPFDLQVIPQRWQIRMAREFPDSVWLDAEHAGRESPDWLKPLSVDIRAQGITELQKFLRHYGADLPPSRAMLGPLLHAYCWNSEATQEHVSSVEIRGLLATLATAFPNPQTASRLKSDLLGQQATNSPADIGRERALLTALATTPDFAAFDATALRCVERGQDLWLAHSQEALSLLTDLANAERNPLGESILDGVGNSLAVADVPRLLNEHPALIQRWLPKHVEWLVVPTLWEQSLDSQRRLLQQIAEQRTNLSPQLGDILAAMIIRGGTKLAHDALKILGSGIVELILDGIANEKIPLPLPPSWRAALSSEPEQLVRFLVTKRPSPRVVALIMQLLDPGSLAIREAPVELWLTHFAQKLDQIPREQQTSGMAFLCCLGMRNAQRRGDDLLVCSLTPTYWALRNGTLPADRWEQLRKTLPERQYRIFSDRDDSDWLLRSFWEQSKQYGWPLSSVFKILADEAVFSSFLGLLRMLDGGKEYRKDLRRFAKWNPTALSHSQLAKLTEKSLLQKVQKVFQGGSADADSDDDDLD